MWGQTKPQTVPRHLPELPVVPLERPIPVPVTSALPDENELRAYLRTAEAIGFEPASLLETKLLMFLREQGIGRIDYQAMSAYLTTQAEKTAQCWFWRPLREKDRPTGWAWGQVWNNSRYQHDWYTSEKWVCRPYHRAVPLRVLGLVEKISEAFPSALFFVTDMAETNEFALSNRPDPFICVTARDVARIVFAVWDEPGFSG